MRLKKVAEKFSLRPIHLIRIATGQSEVSGNLALPPTEIEKKPLLNALEIY